MATREPVVLLHKESHVGLLISGAEAERDSRVEAKAETCLDKARPERSARSRCVASKSNTRILINGTVKRGFGHVEGVYAPSEVVGSFACADCPSVRARDARCETRGRERRLVLVCKKSHGHRHIHFHTAHHRRWWAPRSSQGMHAGVA